MALPLNIGQSVRGLRLPRAQAGGIQTPGATLLDIGRAATQFIAALDNSNSVTVGINEALSFGTNLLPELQALQAQHASDKDYPNIAVSFFNDSVTRFRKEAEAKGLTSRQIEEGVRQVQQFLMPHITNSINTFVKRAAETNQAVFSQSIERITNEASIVYDPDDTIPFQNALSSLQLILSEASRPHEFLPPTIAKEQIPLLFNSAAKEAAIRGILMRATTEDDPGSPDAVALINDIIKGRVRTIGTVQMNENGQIVPKTVTLTPEEVASLEKTVTEYMSRQATVENARSTLASRLQDNLARELDGQILPLLESGQYNQAQQLVLDYAQEHGMRSKFVSSYVNLIQNLSTRAVEGFTEDRQLYAEVLSQALDGDLDVSDIAGLSDHFSKSDLTRLLQTAASARSRRETDEYRIFSQRLRTARQAFLEWMKGGVNAVAPERMKATIAEVLMQASDRITKRLESVGYDYTLVDPMVEYQHAIASVAQTRYDAIFTNIKSELTTTLEIIARYVEFDDPETAIEKLKEAHDQGDISDFIFYRTLNLLTLASRDPNVSIQGVIDEINAVLGRFQEGQRRFKESTNKSTTDDQGWMSQATEEFKELWNAVTEYGSKLLERITGGTQQERQ